MAEPDKERITYAIQPLAAAVEEHRHLFTHPTDLRYKRGDLPKNIVRFLRCSQLAKALYEASLRYEDYSDHQKIA
jgi:hypothetical protein